MAGTFSASESSGHRFDENCLPIGSLTCKLYLFANNRQLGLAFSFPHLLCIYLYLEYDCDCFLLGWLNQEISTE
jgi:hypothetical protein